MTVYQTIYFETADAFKDFKEKHNLYLKSPVNNTFNIIIKDVVVGNVTITNEPKYCVLKVTDKDFNLNINKAKMLDATNNKNLKHIFIKTVEELQDFLFTNNLDEAENFNNEEYNYICNTVGDIMGYLYYPKLPKEDSTYTLYFKANYFPILPPNIPINPPINQPNTPKDSQESKNDTKDTDVLGNQFEEKVEIHRDEYDFKYAPFKLAYDVGIKKLLKLQIKEEDLILINPLLIPMQINDYIIHIKGLGFAKIIDEHELALYTKYKEEYICLRVKQTSNSIVTEKPKEQTPLEDVSLINSDKVSVEDIQISLEEKIKEISTEIDLLQKNKLLVLNRYDFPLISSYVVNYKFIVTRIKELETQYQEVCSKLFNCLKLSSSNPTQDVK